MQRAIITVVGKDTIGIIAGVCTYLAENRINILDLGERRSASRSSARKKRSLI